MRCRSRCTSITSPQSTACTTTDDRWASVWPYRLQYRTEAGGAARPRCRPGAGGASPELIPQPRVPAAPPPPRRPGPTRTRRRRWSASRPRCCSSCSSCRGRQVRRAGCGSCMAGQLPLPASAHACWSPAFDAAVKPLPHQLRGRRCGPTATAARCPAAGFAMRERPPDALLPEFAAEDEDQVGRGRGSVMQCSLHVAGCRCPGGAGGCPARVCLPARTSQQRRPDHTAPARRCTAGSRATSRCTLSTT